MLDSEGQQHQNDADEERPVERHRHDPEIELEQGPVMYGHEAGYSRRFVDGLAGRRCRRDRRFYRFRARRRFHGVEDVAGRNDAAQRKDGCPGDPVAPDRERGDELAVFQPGRRAIDRCTARFIGKHAGDFGIGERLDEAQQHRRAPDREGDVAGRAGDAADREQDQCRHAARHPEGTAPVDGPDQPAPG